MYDRSVATREAAERGGTPASDRAEIAADLRPYPPSWLHQLLQLLERLPGPSWVSYAALGLAVGLIYHLQFWTSGRSPFGQIDGENTFWGVVLFAELWTSAHIERVASSALDATRPALRLSDAESERLRYELTVAPALPSAIALFGAAALNVVASIIDPVGTYVVGSPAPLVVAAGITQTLIIGILFVGLLQLVRQMRLIRTTLERSAIVDPFLPGPLSGFSRLTSSVGIAIIVLVSAGFVLTPIPSEPAAFVTRSLPFLVGAPIIALIAFVVPLYGLHTRLAAEKDRLQGEAEHRLKALLAELNQDVDSRDLSRADGLNKTLASVGQQREILAKLPTWPWSSGTFRAMGTAILLPLFLFVIQLVLSRII
jgi:hypothetical protein